MSQPTSTHPSVAIVTGGTRGLGRAISLAFAKSGYHVVSLYRKDDAAARAWESEIRQNNWSGECLQQDVSLIEPHGTPAHFKRWRAEGWGSQSLILVNNACAAFEPKPFHLTEWADFNAQVSVTLGGSVACIQAALPLLLQSKRGIVANVLSAGVKDPAPKGLSAYLAAKHALQGLGRSLEAEYGERGLQVISIFPNFMETDLTRSWHPAFQSSNPDHPAAVAEELLSLIQGSH